MKKSASLGSRAKICLRALGALTVLAIFALSGLLIAWAVRESGDRTILREKYADLRTRGAPVDNASLTQWYRSLTNTTDVAAWQEIFSDLHAHDCFPKLGLYATADSPASQSLKGEAEWLDKIDARTVVERTSTLRDRIRELAGKRIPVQFIKSFDSLNTPLPHLDELRLVQHLLKIEFLVAFADQDSQVCYETIQGMLSLAQVCAKDPFYIGQMVNIEIHNQAMQNIHRAVEHDLLTDHQIEGLLSTMSQDEIALHRLAYMVQGERAAMIEVAENHRKYPSFNIRSYSNGTLLEFLVPTTNRDIVHLLEFYEAIESFDIADIDLLLSQLADLTKDLDYRVRSSDTLEKSDWAITARLTPKTIVTVEMLVRNAVLERFVRTALAIRLYQKRFGRYPENLEQLQTIGFDARAWKPWGGLPFGYRVCDGEGILWATHPQEGPFTSDDPPQLDDRAVLLDVRRWLYLLFRPVKY